MTSLPYTLQENDLSKRRHVTSLPYTLQENELSKPETCHFSTLYTTDMSPVNLSHSLVVSRVEKSHVSGLLISFSCSL
jgi:hypothetical protein